LGHHGLRKVDLRKLLQKVEAAARGSSELDSEFESTFRSVPPGVTRSIDAAAWLIETELAGWCWNCGHCALRNGASLYVPGSSQILNSPNARIPPDFEPRPEHLRLLQDPKWGKVFNRGFHCNRGDGTVSLAMLAVFLQAKIALTLVQAETSANEVSPRLNTPAARGTAHYKQAISELRDELQTLLPQIRREGT
jgi:hypothetical protein